MRWEGGNQTGTAVVKFLRRNARRELAGGKDVGVSFVDGLAEENVGGRNHEVGGC